VLQYLVPATFCIRLQSPCQILLGGCLRDMFVTERYTCSDRTFCATTVAGARTDTAVSILRRGKLLKPLK
jgi:hypothetical protein